jgi:hypothetical protein
VADVGEAVFLGQLFRPSLDRRTIHLDGRAAVSADQVMVVAAPTPTEQLLAAGQAHGVNLARLCEYLQRSVHGRQPDLRVAVQEGEVQLLGGAEVADLIEQGENFAPLAGIAGRS